MNEQGIFTVITRNSDCSRVSESYVNNVTNLADYESLREKVSVYPNPTHELVNIEVPFTGIYEVLLYDSYGRRVLEETHTEFKMSLSLTGIQEGIYFLHITNDKYRIVRKLIVHKK